MQVERLKNLFKLVKVIKSKYETSKELDFNIFTVLRKENDEVNLHSQFIVELLSNIPHYSNIFLKLFLEEIGELDFFDSKIKVFKEYKNIDILLKNGPDALIIENKIYAEDQENQLERYYKKTKTKYNKVKVFYLTLDGHDPSEKSLGESLSLEKITNLSYKINISEWLEKCIKESSRVPTLRETLIQYLEVVNKLTGNTINKDYQSEVSEYLMKSSKNMLLARDIKQSYEKAINSIKLKFWEELEEAISNDGFLKKYSPRDNDKYSKKMIDDNKKYYGLFYSLIELNSEDKLVLGFEIDHKLYWGYPISRNEKNSDSCKNSERKAIKKMIEEEIHAYSNNLNYNNQSTEWWLAYIYSDPIVNYRFPDTNFLKLADKEYRRNFINDLVKITSEITENIVKRISSDVK